MFGKPDSVSEPEYILGLIERLSAAWAISDEGDTDEIRLVIEVLKIYSSGKELVMKDQFLSLVEDLIDMLAEREQLRVSMRLAQLGPVVATLH